MTEKYEDPDTIAIVETRNSTKDIPKRLLRRPIKNSPVAVQARSEVKTQPVFIPSKINP